jgi:hypothetical protein
MREGARAKPTSTRSMLALTWRRSVPLRKRSPAAQNSVVGDGNSTALINPSEAELSGGEENCKADYAA